MESQDKKPAVVLSKARIDRMAARLERMPPEQQKKVIQVIDYVTSLQWVISEEEEETQ